MVQFRMKMLRALINYLQNEGPATVSEMANDLGRREKLILDYMKHFEKEFEVESGQWGNTRWRTTVTSIQRGYDPDHRTK